MIGKMFYKIIETLIRGIMKSKKFVYNIPMWILSAFLPAERSCSLSFFSLRVLHCKFVSSECVSKTLYKVKQ